ncbi:hypothetical protein D3C85_951950 [compost metagenome]
MTYIRDALDALDDTTTSGRKNYTALYELLSLGGCSVADVAQRLHWQEPNVVKALEKLRHCGLVEKSASRGSQGPMVLYATIRAAECDRHRIVTATQAIRARTAAEQLVANYNVQYHSSI